MSARPSKSLLSLRSKKPKPTRKPLGLDKLNMGDEPSYSAGVPPISDKTWWIRTFSWYNYFHDHREASTWVVDLLESDASGYDPSFDRAAALRAVKAGSRVTLPACVYARILSLGHAVPAEALAYLNAELSSLQGTDGQDEPQKQRVQVQPDDQFLMDMEDRYDAVADGRDPGRLYEALVRDGVKPSSARTAADRIRRMIADLEAAVSGEDQQAAEGYSRYTKRQKQSLLAVYAAMETDIQRYLGNEASRKKARKPRAKKARSSEQIARSARYKAENAGLKVVSLHPSSIVGAREAWVYNDKTRALTRYVALADKTLSIKGTSVTDISNDSMSKTLRKPEGPIQEVLTAGRVTSRTLMDSIKTKGRPASPRLTSDTLILRVIR